jgi:hypothetical protein
MLLERRTVSRKTAGDGKLEITKKTAARIEELGATIAVELNGDTMSAALGTMACTCRGVDNPHVHYFLQSEPLKALQPGAEIELQLDPATQRVLIRTPSSL